MSERQWYYADDGRQAGPVPESDLLERFASGELAPGNLVWTDGMEDWAPADEVELLRGRIGVGAPRPERPESAEGRGAGSRSNAPPPRPWVRYFARSIDVFIASIVLGVAAGLVMPEILELPDAFLGMISFFSWIFMEASLLSLWGTTPGKWILRTELRSASGRLTYSQALKRSVLVWFAGLGMGIPVVSIITLAVSYRTLVRDGTTLWDRREGFTVTHGKIGALRVALTIALVAVFALLLTAQ